MTLAWMDPGAYVARPMAAPTFMVSALLLGVGALTLVRERRSPESAAFFGVCALAASWLFAFSWMYLAADSATAFGWARTGSLLVPFLAPAMYEFAVRVLGIEEKRRRLLLAGWVYFAGCAAGLAATGRLPAGIRLWSWGPYPVFGPWSALFTVPSVAFLVLTQVELWKAWRAAPPGTARLRARAFLVAFLVGGLALIDLLPAYGIGLRPAGFEAVAGFLVIAAWAIWRHRLADFSPALAAEQLVRTTGELVLLCDGHGLIRFANPAACAMVGAGPAELLGRPVRELAASGSSGVTLGTTLERARVTSEEALLRGRGPESVPVSLSSCELRDQNGFRVGTALLARDIRYQRRVQAELARKAFYDDVTGLANRALLEDRIQGAAGRARRSGERFAILCLDLDGLHRVTEAFGRRAGDELLTEVGARLRRAVRDNDSVARIDDDRFGVLVEPVVGAGDARDLALRILAELEPPVMLRGRAVFPSGSIGISVSEPGADAEELLPDAQAAASRASSKVSDRIKLFGPSIREHAVSSLELEGDLRRALAAGEFELHYQPIVRLVDFETVALEALLRWRHPDRGLLTPVAFLGAARDARLLPQIGAWVVDRACAQLATWRELAPGAADLHLHVNLSVEELVHAGLLGRLESTLERHDISPRSLVLEITERMLLQRTEAAIGIVDALRSRGFRLCVDDFGTGYSSLAYLGQYPLDVLKIDAAFLRAAAWGQEGSTILESVLELSRSLGMVSIAEGVDHALQLEQLRRAGCGLAQGYLVARPQEARDVTERLAEGKPLASPPAQSPK